VVVVKKVQVTAMVEMETYQHLADLSRETGKSISRLVREAVEKMLKEAEAR
jgi:predicted DNA-binding protein